MKATVFQEHLEKNCRRCLELEPVFTRNICGFSSIILLQTRQKYAGGLSPGKCFSRSMQQNLPKRHGYTLVKTGSYFCLVRTSSVSFAVSSATLMLPRSSPVRLRTATVFSSHSLSPMVSMYGTFSMVA